MKHIIVSALLALLAPFGVAQAQSLSSQQLASVRLFACADVATARPLMLAGNANSLLQWLNETGGFVVWRTVVTNDELGDAMNGTEVAGLSSLNMQRLQVLAAYSGGSQNMSRADRRAAFDSVFSGAGGAITRASMAVLWKRIALRVEQALASGTGTTLAPGLLTYEGALSSATPVVFRDDGTLWGCS